MVRREWQRLGRVVKELKGVITGAGEGQAYLSVDYQKKMRDLKEALGEKLWYNPYSEPMLLVIEAEFNQGLYQAQVRLGSS